MTFFFLHTQIFMKCFVHIFHAETFAKIYYVRGTFVLKVPKIYVKVEIFAQVGYVFNKPVPRFFLIIFKLHRCIVHTLMIRGLL